MSYYFLFSEGRRMGKTTAICKAAKEIGAIVLCSNQTEAFRVKNEHGVETAVLDSERLLGINKPFLIDTEAAGKALIDLENKVSVLQKKIDRYERFLNNLSFQTERVVSEKD